MLLTKYDPNREIYGGCDLSTTTDLTSFAMLQKTEGYGWICNWWFWIPEERAAECERRDNVPYRRWEEEGYIRFTPSRRILHDFVARDIIEACVEHDCSRIGFDPWNAAWLESKVEQEGIEAIEVRQGYAALSEPSKHFEASVADGTFRHGGNPVARWQASNCEVQSDVNNNIRPVKPEHGSSKRVDGIVAAIIGIAVALASGTDDIECPYSEPGGLFL